jgi:hypothetical protein
LPDNPETIVEEAVRGRDVVARRHAGALELKLQDPRRKNLPLDQRLLRQLRFTVRASRGFAHYKLKGTKLLRTSARIQSKDVPLLYDGIVRSPRFCFSNRLPINGNILDAGPFK